MNEPRSSSNRAATVCDAVLLRAALGPIRLPLNRADDFVDHFNRTYQGLGMRLAAVPKATNEKIPDSVEAVGDHDSG